MANIVDNAIKYTQRSGRITLSLSKDGDRVELNIADNGPGIPQKFYSKVIEKFFRLEQSRSSTRKRAGPEPSQRGAEAA